MTPDNEALLLVCCCAHMISTTEHVFVHASMLMQMLRTSTFATHIPFSMQQNQTSYGLSGRWYVGIQMI